MCVCVYNTITDADYVNNDSADMQKLWLEMWLLQSPGKNYRKKPIVHLLKIQIANN